MIRNRFHRRNISSCEHKLGNIWLRMGYLSKSKLLSPENVEHYNNMPMQYTANYNGCKK